MLEFEKLFLFFKIIDNLLKRFFKYQNLFLKNFDLFLLKHSSSFILVIGLSLNQNVSLLILGVTIKFCFFSFVVIEGVPLTHSFLSKLLILVVDIPLDFLNITLSILLCLILKLLKRCFVFEFFLLLHSSKLNFNEILFFLERLLKTGTILLPCHKFKLILKLFLANILHFLQVFIKLTHFDICVFDLIFSLSINLLNFFIISTDSIISLLFIFLLKSLYFIFQLNKMFGRFGIVGGEPENDVFSVLDLLLVSVLKVVDFGVPIKGLGGHM